MLMVTLMVISLIVSSYKFFTSTPYLPRVTDHEDFTLVMKLQHYTRDEVGINTMLCIVSRRSNFETAMSQAS